MTGVDRLGVLLAQLRGSLLEKWRRSEKSSRPSAPARIGKQANLIQSAGDIQTGLLSHLAGLDLQIDGNLQQARRIFIELVLVSEFGGRIANDPRFTRIAEQVESAMSADAAISEELNAVLRDLASLGFLSAEVSGDPELFRLALRSGLIDSITARFGEGADDSARALSQLGKVRLTDGGNPVDVRLDGARLVGGNLEARVELC